jgi:hypothetical protein
MFKDLGFWVLLTTMFTPVVNGLAQTKLFKKLT